METRKEIGRLLGELKKITIKQVMLMNIIIEELLKSYHKGELTTGKTSDEDISVNEIYNKAIKLLNDGQSHFAYENEMPVCIIQLNENIKQLEATLESNTEEMLKGMK